MQPRKFRILSAITAGSLALAVVAITASSGASHTATHAALAAQTETFPPVNLNDCPILHTGYPTGECVAQLQTDLDIIQGNHLVVDGTFGPETYKAVIAFQQAQGLPRDGMVGPDTKKALDAALSVPTLTVPPVPAPAPASSTTSPPPASSADSGAASAAPTGPATPASGLSTTDFKCKNWNAIATFHQIPIPTSWICGYIGQGGRSLDGISNFRQEGWFNTLVRQPHFGL